jgi:putative addiction module component (TIGR02574 family)
MTTAEIKKILKLPKSQKIKLVQTIWDDIAHQSGTEPVSKEHAKILNERIALIKNGKAKFRDWEEVKKKFRKNALS